MAKSAVLATWALSLLVFGHRKYFSWKSHYFLVAALDSAFTVERADSFSGIVLENI